MTPEPQIQRPPQKKYTVPEFAARIRARYPSPKYDQMSDDELTMRMVKKHPVYKDHIDFGTEQDALAAVSRTKTRVDQAQQNLMSAAGRVLNPTVTPGTDYFRPLTPAETAAQRRGDPVVISEAGQPAPATPQTAPGTSLGTQPPVSLGPVIQSHLEQIQRQQRRRELQAKVAQARQVRDRLPKEFLLPPGQRNDGADYKPTWGKRQPYRQLPPVDTSVPNPVELLAPAAKQGLTFEQDRAARVAAKEAKRPLQGIGDLRRYEAREAKAETRIKSHLRAQVLKEEAAREAAAASGTEAQLMAQRARQEGMNPPDIEGQVEERYQSYLRSVAPGMVEQRKVFGELSPAVRSVAAPVARSIGGLMKTAGGIAGLGGLTENDFSRWANTRGAFVEESASLAPLNEQGEAIVRGLPEQAVAAATDLGLSISQLVLLKKATGVPLGRLMALETVLKTTDAPLKDRAKQVAQSYAMGSVLDQHLGRLASATLFGAQPGLQSLAAYQEGDMTLEDALLQTGIQAGAGFILGGKGAKQLPKEAIDYTLKSPLTPEPVKDVVADVMKYGKGLVRSEDGRNLSLYADPQTGNIIGGEITAEQAKKYDPTIVTGKKRPVRSAKEISAEEYDTLAQTLGIETKTPAKQLPGEVERPEPKVEKPVSSTAPVVESKEVKPVSRPKEAVSSTPESKEAISPRIQENITEAITTEDLSKAANKISAIPTLAKTPDIIPELSRVEPVKAETEVIPRPVVPAVEPAVTPPAEFKTPPAATESQLTTVKEVTDEVDAEARSPITVAAPGQATVPDKQPWKVSQEEYAFNAGAPKPEIDLMGDVSRHQLSSMSERAIRERAKTKVDARRGASTKYQEAASEWEQKVLDAYKRNEFSLNDVYDPDSNDNAFYVVRKSIEETGIPIDSPFKIGKLSESERSQYLNGIDALVVARNPPINEGAKSGNGLQAKVADIPPASKEPKSAIPAKLTDWSTRLKTIAQAKNLDDLQALSDEMAAHKDDPRVARLRMSIQDSLANARQPEIPEREPEKATVPKAVSKAAQKTLSQAEQPEGKTVRTAPTHRIGAPKLDTQRNSLEQQVRAYGGVKDDADQTYKGELQWLSESGKRGTVNQTSGMTAEKLATSLAQDGYGKGVWWEDNPNNVDPQKFLQAVMDDTRGQKHYSSERDAIEDDPDVKAWDTLTETDTGKELIERVQSGHARAADIVQFVREASAHGLSDQAIDAFVAGLQRTIQEELSGGTEAAEGYSFDDEETLLDPDGTPLFSRAFHGSPYDFDKFSTEKIGTGEGAQAYGYGLYFTDKKEIADYYRKQLEPGRGAQPRDIAARIHQSLPESLSDAEKVEATVRELQRRKADSDPTSQNFLFTMDEAIKAVRAGQHRGRTYEVELAPKEDEYLLWDKPLKHQSEKVQQAFKQDRPHIGMHITGEAAYLGYKDSMALRLEVSPRHNAAAKAASDYFHSLGIRGIKFLDQGSRWADLNQNKRVAEERVAELKQREKETGFSHRHEIEKLEKEISELKPSYNYVIFSDKDVEIVQQPQFAREFQLGLPAEGLTQQEAPKPKTTDQREALIRAQQERDEAADPEKAAALRKLEEIRRRGMTVDEYSRQGSMFEAAPSAEEIKLLKDIERKHPPPESGQSSMFATGKREAGEGPITVEGNRIYLGEKGAEALSRAYRKLDFLTRRQSVGGAVDRNPQRLAKTLDGLKETELAKAVREAAAESPKEVILYEGESERSHELFHVASGSAGQTLRNRHADLDSLTDNDTFDKIYRSLIRMGYPGREIPTLVEEAAAHIAEGRYEQLGITRDEAVEWVFKWFTSFEAKNPHVNPRQFQELANEAEEARKRVYEAAGRQPQSDQTLPSVQAGREGGDRESIAAARESDLTQTEAFKRWFGESKVVDEDGKPLVVYHGTNVDFSEFSIPRNSVGIWLGRDADSASRYAHIKGRWTGGGDVVMPAYASIKNPASYDMMDQLNADARNLGKSSQWVREELQAKGYDGVKVDDGYAYIAFESTQIKSATGNRGTFDPYDPNILMARSDDPWADLMELSEEFGRLANEPELAPGEKPRSLPRTLEMAGLEAGPERGYLPETLDEGVERAKQVISEKGVDGAIEFVKTGDGIEWASTGYEVSGQLREQESQLRAAGKTDEADETRDKRLKFLDDFAAAAIERGRSIVGIKAIAEYAPDRMAYALNKASIKKRKHGISPDEEARITRLGEELGALEDRNKALEKALDTAKAQAKRRTPTFKSKKTDYQSALELQAESVLQTLKPKVGKLDLSGLERTTEKGAVTIGIPALPGDAELIAQYAAAKLGTLNTAAELNQHLVQEFGQDIEQHLPKIRQRAYAIRATARQAEIELSETEPKRRKSILTEIQKEISESLTAIRDAQRAQDQAAKAEKAAQVKSERTVARSEARQARETEHETRRLEIKEARARLKQQRQEYKQAAKAETEGYRQSIKAQREAARRAELWDMPLRNEATKARARLQQATDPNDPQTAEDLIAVAAEKFLPELEHNKDGSVKATQPAMGAVEPARVYRDLKEEFPTLVTKKNQGDLYKKGYQRIQDATAAAREAARLRSATAESQRLWNELGVDVDAQGILIQQAEVQRQRQELRSKAAAEFNRVSKTMLEKVWMEVQSFPRSLQSSIDAPLGRQGAFFLITHPVTSFKSAVPATLQGYGSINPVDYARHETDLKQHPDYALAIKSGLDLSETAGSADPALVAEEQFQSPLASKIFPHVRLSEQGYVLGMNAQRLALFARLADLGRAEGYTPEDKPEFFEEVAKFVNDGSGRGTLPDALKRASALTNFFFFSTRLNLSRIQLLNDLFNPVKYIPEPANPFRAVPGFGSYDPVMRKVMAQELIRLAVALGTIFLIAKAMGIKVETDLDDPDALLLRVRNTRYDITGGEAGTIRFLYRFMRSIYRTATGDEMQEFEQPLSIASKFLRYKLAPIPSGTIDALTGKDAVGQPANLTKFKSPKQVLQENVIIRRLIPMMTGNVIDAVSEEGWIGIPMVLPAVAGFGVSSYPDRGIRAIKNQSVVDLLESLKITSNSLLGQKTKDDDLDKLIQAHIMEKVEILETPQGATEIGKEKIVKERLAQIRNLARAEAAIQDPKRYTTYLRSKEGSESVSVLTDEEKKTLTEQDLSKYREIYATAYVEMLQRAAQAEKWPTLTDDQKEKVLARIPRIAHNRAKIDLVKTKRNIP